MGSAVRIFSIIVVNFILFLLVFILVEGVLRIAGIPYKGNYVPSENSYARFDPELGWSYIPNKSTFQMNDDSKTPVYFDENGFRVPRPGFHTDILRPSVLFIGDSFTFGHGLSYEDSFAGKFSTLEGMPYQTINIGVQGYGSDQALLALKRHLPKFNIKVVVYTFIEDHILRNSNYDRRMIVPTARFLGTKPQFDLDSKNELYLARKALLYKDYFNSFLFDLLKIRLGSRLGFFPPYREDVTKAIIREMKRYCDEHGVHFVILNWRWTMKDYDDLHDLDIDIIDTLVNSPDDWEKMVLFKGVHPDARAGDHAARLLLDYFRERGLLQDQPGK
ncbi:MAG: hypothetical protein HY758_03660 [Nitrospirae bacterium]|nr:hypothetical protein [Nitrospirota bacterium]